MSQTKIQKKKLPETKPARFAPQKMDGKGIRSRFLLGRFGLFSVEFLPVSFRECITCDVHPPPQDALMTTKIKKKQFCVQGCHGIPQEKKPSGIPLESYGGETRIPKT